MIPSPSPPKNTKYEVVSGCRLLDLRRSSLIRMIRKNTSCTWTSPVSFALSLFHTGRVTQRSLAQMNERHARRRNARSVPSASSRVCSDRQGAPECGRRGPGAHVASRRRRLHPRGPRYLRHVQPSRAWLQCWGGSFLCSPRSVARMNTPN